MLEETLLILPFYDINTSFHMQSLLTDSTWTPDTETRIFSTSNHHVIQLNHATNSRLDFINNNNESPDVLSIHPQFHRVF